jgi:hypothetical protein
MMSIRDNAKAEQLYNDRWFPMELGFGGDAKERTENLELFLRHYLTMLKHATVKEDRIYAEIRDRLKLADENNVISELNSMSRYAVYYQRLLFPQKETNNIIAKGIDRLNRFGISVHYPFLLKVYNAFEAGKVSVADFNIILKTIESYYVRRFFMQLPTNALNKLFALLCSLPDDNLASALQAELASKEPTSTAYWPDDKDFKEKFVLLPVYRDTDRCCHQCQYDCAHPAIPWLHVTLHPRSPCRPRAYLVSSTSSAQHKSPLRRSTRLCCTSATMLSTRSRTSIVRGL